MSSTGLWTRPGPWALSLASPVRAPQLFGVSRDKGHIPQMWFKRRLHGGERILGRRGLRIPALREDPALDSLKKGVRSRTLTRSANDSQTQ